MAPSPCPLTGEPVPRRVLPLDLVVVGVLLAPDTQGLPLPLLTAFGTRTNLLNAPPVLAGNKFLLAIDAVWHDETL